ncbi:putative proteinPH-dependent 7-cyano-7-deazaguanine reductase, partial [Pseudomonas syringae pv. maculicola]
MACGLKRIC